MSAAGAVAVDPLSQSAVDAAEQRFRRMILAALVLGAVSLAVLVAASLLLYRRGVNNNAWVEHTYAAETKVAGLATEVEKLETARRGYLLDAREGFWRTYVETRGRIRPAAADLAEFTADNPVQVRNSALLSELIEQKFAQMRDTIELAHDGDLQAARDNFLHLSELHVTQRLRDTLGAMEA